MTGVYNFAKNIMSSFFICEQCHLLNPHSHLPHTTLWFAVLVFHFLLLGIYTFQYGSSVNVSFSTWFCFWLLNLGSYDR